MTDIWIAQFAMIRAVELEDLPLFCTNERHHDHGVGEGADPACLEICPSDQLPRVPAYTNA